MLDKHTGEIALLCRYTICQKENPGFDPNLFHLYWNEAMILADTHYGRFFHLCCGEVTKEEYYLYKEIIKYALESLTTPYSEAWGAAEYGTNCAEVRRRMFLASTKSLEDK